MAETYLELAKDPFYRLLLGIGPALNGEDWGELCRDTKRLAILKALQKCQVLAPHAQLTADESTDEPEASHAIKALGELGLELNHEALETVESDEDLLVAYVKKQDERLYSLIGAKYHLPQAVAGYLLEEDLRVFKSLLTGKGDPPRFETYRQRAVKRLEIHKWNHNVLDRVTADFGIEKKAFFDVGCLFGLSMVSASRIGFKESHGCEVDSMAYRRARQTRALSKSVGIEYYEGDFLDLELSRGHYTLVLMINVLEHTSDIGKTIDKLSPMLDQHGICYIYQGNPRSIAFARLEPHYHLPLLLLLPKDLAISILVRMGRIGGAEQYVVNRWPQYEELHALFQESGLRADFSQENLGYFGRAQASDASKILAHLRTLKRESEEKIYPVLDAEERVQVGSILESYSQEVIEQSEKDSAMFRLKYLRPTWDIIVRKCGAGEGDSRS